MPQVKLTPYRHAEDNVLKVAVEAHIFLLVSIALVLKSLRAEAGGEVIPEGALLRHPADPVVRGRDCGRVFVGSQPEEGDGGARTEGGDGDHRG